MKTKLLPLLGGLLLLGLCGVAHAGVHVADSPFAEVKPSSAPLCVSASTTTWTAWPPIATGNMQQRDGFWILIDPSNNANAVGLITPASDTTTPTTSKRDFLFIKGNPTATLSFDQRFQLWVKSLHTSAEEVCGREYRLR